MWASPAKTAPFAAMNQDGTLWNLPLRKAASGMSSPLKL